MTTNEQRKIFAKNLAYYVSCTGKSQKDVAKDLGVNYTTFNMWMSGNSMPRMGMVQAIADYFHVRNIDLINEHNAEDEETNIVPLHPDIKEAEEDSSAQELIDSCLKLPKEQQASLLALIKSMLDKT